MKCLNKLLIWEQLQITERAHHNATHFVHTPTNYASQCLTNTEVRTYRSLNALGDSRDEVAFTAGGYNYITYKRACRRRSLKRVISVIPICKAT